MICFGVLTVFYPICAIADDQYGLDGVVVTGYYGFFTLFFLGVIIKQKHLMHYCGFVNSLWIKSLFYIFCASLGFAQFDIIVCDICGAIMAIGAILNMIRCCGGQDDIGGQKA